MCSTCEDGPDRICSQADVEGYGPRLRNGGADRREDSKHSTQLISVPDPPAHHTAHLEQLKAGPDFLI